jgi:large subunit ribosomal protein L11
MQHAHQVSGLITRKHVYEIAKLKSEDEMWQEFDLKDICEKVIDEAYTIGIHVKDELDPVEYGQFLEERAKINEDERAKIQSDREAKLLRTI